MLGPIYAIFVQEIGGDILVAGSSFAIYTGTIGVLILIFGKLEDGLNQKMMFVIGSGLSVIGIAGYNFISEPIHLFIVQGILGTSLAIIYPALDSLYSRGLSRRHEASEWSIWEGANAITLAISAFVGSIIVATFGFKTLFLFMTGLSVVGFFIALIMIKKRDFVRRR